MALQSRRISEPAPEGASSLEPPSNVGTMIPEQQTASAPSTRKRHDVDAFTGVDTFTRRARPGIHAGLLFLVFVGLLAGLYAGILRYLAWQWWDDPNYAHGFLVPIFSGFLVWQRRKQLAALPANGSWIGLPVLLAGVVALLLGQIGAELFLMRGSLIVILAGLVL